MLCGGEILVKRLPAEAGFAGECGLLFNQLVYRLWAALSTFSRSF